MNDGVVLDDGVSLVETVFILEEGLTDIQVVPGPLVSQVDEFVLLVLPCLLATLLHHVIFVGIQLLQELPGYLIVKSGYLPVGTVRSK